MHIDAAAQDTARSLGMSGTGPAAPAGVTRATATRASPVPLAIAVPLPAAITAASVIRAAERRPGPKIGDRAMTNTHSQCTQDGNTRKPDPGTAQAVALYC